MSFGDADAAGARPPAVPVHDDRDRTRDLRQAMSPGGIGVGSRKE
jgi:hypothetical protein